jgi:hypothetical protein
MLANFEWPKPADSGDEKVISDVQRHGCHLVSVLADQHGPGFVYSIGLYLNFGHPEVIVFGLKPEVAGRVLNHIRELARGGETIGSGSTSDAFLEDLSVSFLAVGPEHYRDHLGFALWFYRSLLPETFPCLQLVWPDKSGVFPWQEGFDESYAHLQPLLGRVA